MMKKLYLFLFLFAAFNAQAQEEPVVVSALKEVFKAPESPEKRDQWLTVLKNWRERQRSELKYNDILYVNPKLKWVKHAFIDVQMMAHDRYFYDPITRKYTVKRYLDDLKKRYGGIDAVLIWPTYPNIGIDNRNQFDLTYDMPGGKPAIKQMIKDFKANGVAVFFPIMAWDYGTNKFTGSMPEALVKEMKELGADGLNGDTMTGVTEDFYKFTKAENYPLAFQPELNLKELKMIEWNTLSWGYFWGYEHDPGVSVYKWFEPRHQVNVTNRWATNKTDDLQYAFFNGIGYNTWENIWAVWNQIPERYAESIRRISAIYRQFPNVWSSAHWEPHIKTEQKGVFASKFPDDQNQIYTLVNRDATDAQGAQLVLAHKSGQKYWDLWNGKQLTPQVTGDKATLSFNIEGFGFGSVLVTQGATPKGLSAFLQKMSVMSKRELKTYASDWKPALQQIVNMPKTKPSTAQLDEMVKIPAVKGYKFESVGVMIEGNELPQGVGVQHPWEKHPSRSQKHTIDIPSFYIDKYPVTNKQFKAFLTATKYKPADAHNFLKDWVNGTYPAGEADLPVTWVSLDDARAYAKWAGKRLPHEWEWQYAAQGTDGRLYPWGNDNNRNNYPPDDTTRAMRKPTPVNAFPQGASPFGVVDMVGNIWQWTDEYLDEHSRAAILKGSSYYHAQTSGWYFPPALELNKYGKYLLMAPSIDRARTIGFRCVVDAN